MDWSCAKATAQRLTNLVLSLESGTRLGNGGAESGVPLCGGALEKQGLINHVSNGIGQKKQHQKHAKPASKFPKLVRRLAAHVEASKTARF
jgi:hypothetical protein